MLTPDNQLMLGMASGPAIVLLIIGGLIALPLAIVAIVYLVVPTVKGIIWFVKHVFTFIIGMIGDALRLIGTVLTTLVLVPLVVGNVLIGRWSASAHYGRAIQGEVKTAGRSFYRLAIGHIARLLCMHALTEGIERRIPEVVAAAPGSDRPSRRLGQFEGYTIVGSLAGGGSGGKLYVAKPSEQKLAAFVRSGQSGVDQVVIKCFTLGDGSSLPQIVRENRALDAAKRLGLILEHDLNEDRFFYVMRYVPGESLNLVTQRLHAMSGGNGLAKRELGESLEYTADLLRTLAHYHAGGLWHKDVKPDNIIVSDGQAHLVDFGLITPLRSSMTLTTHGTEYFRDPEMVRLALKGVKVQDVDGAKFDLYAVGAVLYSMIENSFPAHGGLSQISRSCPEVIRMIVRRAMTDYDKRYATAMDMLADIEAVLRAQDPYAMKLIALPSMRSAGDAEARAQAEPVMPQVHAAAWGQYTPVGAGMPPPIPGVQQAAGAGGSADGAAWAAAGVASAPAGSPRPVSGSSGRMKPKLRVTSWWRGTYVTDEAPAAVKTSPFVFQASIGVGQAAARAAWSPAVNEPAATPAASKIRPVSAAEQIEHARERARTAQARIHAKMQARSRNHASGINFGVVAALLVFVIGCMALVVFGIRMARINLSGPVLYPSASMPTHVVPNRMVPEPPVEYVHVDGAQGPVVVVPASDRQARFGVPTDHHTTAVVLCNWSQFDAAGQEFVRSRLTKLSDAGFVLIGDVLSEGTMSEDHLSVVANLRSVIGTRVFKSKDAREALESAADDFATPSLVVWVGNEPGVSTGASPTMWVMNPGEVHEGIEALATQSVRR